MWRRDLGIHVARSLMGTWRRRLGPIEISDATFNILGTSGACGLVGAGLLEKAQLTPNEAMLVDVYKRQRLASAVHRQWAQEAMQALAAEGVLALLGKGLANEPAYAMRGMRVCGDIDLYVAPADHDRAKKCLDTLEDPGPFDLHRGCGELDDRSWATLIDRSTFAEDGIRIFGAEDHLRLIGLHGLRHGLRRPIWLCDIAAAVESLPATFDLDYFLFGSSRRTDYVLRSIQIAVELLGARPNVPLPVASVPSWALETVLSMWGRPYRPLRAMRTTFSDPIATLVELSHRWPNRVEATVAVKGSFSRPHQLPYQLEACRRRLLKFGASLLEQ